MALVTALAVPMAITPDTADAGWKKFWKQVASKDCWKRFSITNAGYKKNCKV